MRWIVESSLRLAAFVLAVVVLILFVGALALRHAPVDTLPEFLPPQVQVQTEALGLSAAEVEQFITVPLEDEFNGLAYLDHLRSQSVPGLSAIELTFKPGTNIYKARQLVTERVAQGPSVVNVGSPPVVIQPLSSESRVMMIGLSSKTESMIDLSTLARWRIRPRLLAVPGVANVTIWGQRDRQLQVLVDPARMRAHGVSLDQVINTAGDALWTSPLTFVEASSPGADGFIDSPNQRLSVQHVLPIRTAARSGRGTGRRDDRQAASSGPGDHGGRGPPRPQGRRRAQERGGLHPGGREVPRREHPRGDARDRRRLERLEARSDRDHRGHDDLPPGRLRGDGLARRRPCGARRPWCSSWRGSALPPGPGGWR